MNHKYFKMFVAKTIIGKNVQPYNELEKNETK